MEKGLNGFTLICNLRPPQTEAPSEKCVNMVLL